MGVDSLTAFKQKIPDLKKSLKNDADLFKSVYNFTFEFTQEQGKKNIDVDYAKALWPILMSDKCQFLDKWLTFIEKSEVKSIKKDQWQMFYQLCIQTKGVFANFVDDGCW